MTRLEQASDEDLLLYLLQLVQALKYEPSTQTSPSPEGGASASSSHPSSATGQHTTGFGAHHAQHDQPA